MTGGACRQAARRRHPGQACGRPPGSRWKPRGAPPPDTARADRRNRPRSRAGSRRAGRPADGHGPVLPPVVAEVQQLVVEVFLGLAGQARIVAIGPGAALLAVAGGTGGDARGHGIRLQDRPLRRRGARAGQTNSGRRRQACFTQNRGDATLQEEMKANIWVEFQPGTPAGGHVNESIGYPARSLRHGINRGTGADSEFTAIADAIAPASPSKSMPKSCPC